MTGLMTGLRKAFRFLLALAARGRGAEAEIEAKPHPWEASYPPGLSWRFEADSRPLFSVLDDAVAAYPDNPCLEFLGKRYSYREVGDLVARVARGLQGLGVGKGTRVGLFLPNCPYFVICFHAVLKAGGTVVNFNPLYAEREVARQIRDSGTEIMVTLNLRSLLPRVAARLDDTGLRKIVVCPMTGALPFPNNALFALLKRKEIASVPAEEAYVKFDKLAANTGDPAAPRIDPERDIAVLQYTGGTTGTPKGAMLTHGTLYANTTQTRLWASEVEPGREKVLAVLPLFHVFGMTAVMNVGLMIGAELLLLPRFKVSEVLSAIDKEKPSMLFGVPTMYSAINGHKERDGFELSSLKFCVSGGAALPREIQTTFERLTGCVLVEGYGLTEAGPVCTINPIGGRNKPGSAGLPVPGTLIEVASLEDSDEILPLGQIGEILVTGPQVMAGYWRQEAESAAVLRDGRLRTGDVGYVDEEGYVFLIDRIKDLIITGGFNVYPRMVEEAIYLHPAVAEAAVCGVPNQHHGETVKAFVKLRAEATLTVAELRDFLKDKLAPFERPRQVEFLDVIPMTLVGKPLRRELAAREARKAQADAPEERPLETSEA